MTQLFETSRIKDLTLANRLVRSATWEGLAADDGRCTPRLAELMVALAEGEVGLIITGHAYVSPEGQAGPWQLGLSSDEQIEPLRQMVEQVHRAGGKIAVQLAHAGCHAATALTGTAAIGPSALAADKNVTATAMTTADLDRIIEAFAAAAVRAGAAGFDAIQFHAAHGYLLSQFLSPYYNHRSDHFGGGIDHRVRFPAAVVARTRERVGGDVPLLIKMNSEDFLDPGLTCDDMLVAAAHLQAAGIDAVELSGGTILSGKLMPVRKGNPVRPEDEVYYREAARRFKQRFDLPLILVGGIRSRQVAEALVAESVCDYVAMSRPLIREPDLARRWRLGQCTRAACDSDNLCFRPATSGMGIHCVVARRLSAAE